MTYSRQAVAYRDREIKTASPGRLVVLVFDSALSNLYRARRGVQTSNIEERVTAVRKAREAIMELYVTLNVEQGGAIARNLQSLYAFILSELGDVARRPDGARLESLITMVTELRSAFESVATDTARTPAA
ncbi:MAG: flagellar export chaperone FliS [Gemmatimonadaceae bacterium]